MSDVSDKLNNNTAIVQTTIEKPNNFTVK